VRFTAMMKNRMRRYLDAFHSFTISNKEDTEEFLEVIIGLPDPNPQNQQRRIKVYRWETLSGALEKILSKFTVLSRKLVSD
jgi:hypothetical protein